MIFGLEDIDRTLAIARPLLIHCRWDIATFIGTEVYEKIKAAKMVARIVSTRINMPPVPVKMVAALIIMHMVAISRHVPSQAIVKVPAACRVHMRNGEIMPCASVEVVPTTAGMSVPACVVVPDAVVKIVSAAGMVAMVPAEVRKPDTFIVKVAAPGTMDMA